MHSEATARRPGSTAQGALVAIRKPARPQLDCPPCVEAARDVDHAQPQKHQSFGSHAQRSALPIELAGAFGVEKKILTDFLVFGRHFCRYRSVPEVSLRWGEGEKKQRGKACWSFYVDGKGGKGGENNGSENYALRRRRWRGTKAIAAGRRSRFLAGVIPVLCSLTKPWFAGALCNTEYGVWATALCSPLGPLQLPWPCLYSGSLAVAGAKNLCLKQQSLVCGALWAVATGV